MILDETNQTNLIFLILQFLHDEGHHGSLHLLEQDSRVFFDYSYFSNAIINGNWKEADTYLEAFTCPDENIYSRKMFFDFYKWKFSESPDRSAGSEAVKMYSEDLRKIPVFKDDGYDDLVEVIDVDDIRQGVKTSSCMDKTVVRARLCGELRKLAESNPSLCGKLVLPKLNKSALLALIITICPNCNEKKEDLIFLILQFLYEAKYKSTLHKLEQETKVFFNLNYLAEVMKLGEFGKAEEYLREFVGTDGNKYSNAMFLEVQKLKCPESTPSGSLGNNNMSPKFKLHNSVAMLAKKNPLLRDKLKFPKMEKSRLLKLMKQTMDWWEPNTCKTSNSLENVPVIQYLCGAPTSLGNKVNETERKTKEISYQSECNSLILPDCFSDGRIARLTYSPSGDYILALSEDGSHKLWTWSSSQNELFKENVFSKLIPRILKENVFPKPRLHQPQSGKLMENEIAADNPTSCFAIKGSYLFSTSGGKIAVFDIMSFEKVASFGSPTPMATYFIFIPDDLLAVGLDDGSIFIHCLSSRKIKEKLEGHDKRITCLAFSHCFNVLVSSGADGKLCVWSTKSWVKLTSNNSMHKLCTRLNHESSLVTHIEFDPYQIELLVVQELLIGVYKAPALECRMQWVPDESEGSITCATYSSDGGDVMYVGFRSGCIKIVNTDTYLTICRINPTVFTQSIFSNRLEVYPAVVVAHPSNRSQISVGLNNGKVIVLQPLERRGWGEAAPPEDNGDCSDGSDHCY